MCHFPDTFVCITMSVYLYSIRKYKMMFLVFLVFLQFNSLFLYYSDTFIFTINSVFLIPNLLNMEVFQVFITTVNIPQYTYIVLFSTGKYLGHFKFLCYYKKYCNEYFNIDVETFTLISQHEL